MATEKRQVQFDIPPAAEQGSEDLLATPATNDLTSGVQDSSHLMEQSLTNLDPAKLTPLTPEVISRQATINIGTMDRLKILLFRFQKISISGNRDF